MHRELRPNEREALLRRWYSPDELKALSKWDPKVVEHDIYSTADVILRRRADEEAESARATLTLTHTASSDWPADERVAHMLKAALEVLSNDQDRERFKFELAGVLGLRPARDSQR